MFKIDRKYWALLTVLTVMIVLMSRQIGNPHISFPDADRLMMDGVFILDFLRDLPLTRIYDYTVNYYAQYPGLSIGYRPPFFPFVEALFNGLFGVNTWSSRLAVLAFALVTVDPPKVLLFASLAYAASGPIAMLQRGPRRER